MEGQLWRHVGDIVTRSTITTLPRRAIFDLVGRLIGYRFKKLHLMWSKIRHSMADFRPWAILSAVGNRLII
jgi:hypothetical protein